MQNTSTTTQATAAQVPQLSAAMKRLRLKYLKSVKELPLDEALETLRAQLSKEDTENGRLGSLAAQTWIIRQRFGHLGNETLPVIEDCLTKLEPKRKNISDLKKLAAKSEPAEESVKDTETESWKKVKILEETVVNGMRFFADFIVEVNGQDADKLVEAKKAEYVTNETTVTDAPAPETPKEEAAKAKPQKATKKKTESQADEKEK